MPLNFSTFDRRKEIAGYIQKDSGSRDKIFEGEGGFRGRKGDREDKKGKYH